MNLETTSTRRDAIRTGTIALASGIAIFAAGKEYGPELFERTFKPDTWKINQEIEKMGVLESITEKTLWDEETTDESTLPVSERISKTYEDTLARMLNSENPYFQSTGYNLMEAISNNQLVVDINDHERLSTTVELTISPSLIHTLSFFEPFTKEKPIQRAFTLTYMAKLLSNRLTEINAIDPNLTYEERYLEFISLHDSSEEAIIAKAKAEAERMDALIYSYGLGAYKPNWDTSTMLTVTDEELAIKYIDAKRDPLNPKFIAGVKDHRK